MVICTSCNLEILHGGCISCFFTVPCLVSFARVNLGVHYPSDCVAGAIMGILVCVIGKFLWFADSYACGCNGDIEICYAGDNVLVIDPWNLSRINFWVLAGALVGQLLFSVLMVVKPLKFWVKFGSVFGFLFPALTFRFVFLCPVGELSASLARPYVMYSTSTFPHWWALIYALGACLIGMGVGMKLQKKCNMVVFVGYWIFYTGAISVWRLFRLGEEFKFN
eukprot:TRINITY_DN3230_c0_g1_i2.p1 TRINITY_DN3230_c0_g1~~TRINITY_DN3230_c0_g1_i2.p1  ORF type:complete len:222 (-),score=18.55 TRINITY_DN3230_c0_g1_i2:341-1006(-)